MVKLRKTLSVCVAIFVFALLTQYSIQQTEKTTEVRYVNTSDDISENTMELHVKNAIEPDVENTMEPDVENIEHNSKCGEKEERAFKSDIDLAKVEFERVETIFVILVFIMIVVLAKMIWHHRLMHNVSSNIPESCMLIVVGAHIGGIIIGSFRLGVCNQGNPPLRFSPNLFFLFLLPPIVLEAGYFIDSRAFFANITTIVIYAVIGTIWNVVAIGLTLLVLSNNDLLLTGDSFEMKQFSFFTAFLFGTICAAVDPVAVLAVFEDIHVNKLLHILVFGESLLNGTVAEVNSTNQTSAVSVEDRLQPPLDLVKVSKEQEHDKPSNRSEHAVTIVLFTVLSAFSNRPFDSGIDVGLDPDARNVTVADALKGVAQFFVVVIASLIIGVATGIAASFITRFSAHVHVLEPMIIFVMGYLSYILADMFEWSGIVSLIFCAIVMRHYIEPNLSRKSSTTTKYALKVVSNVSEMIIFLFLGVSLYDTRLQTWDTGLSLWTIFFCALYRPIGVVVLTLIVNIFRDKKIGYKSVFVMSYSGLRGAVSFSLALSRVNEEPSLQTTTDPLLLAEANLRKAMFTAITVLVLFTVFVQGITIKPLVKLIKVRTASDKKPTMNEVIHTATIDHLLSGIEGIMGFFGQNRLSEKLMQIDQKYLRKVFERYPEAGDEQILHTFNRLQQKESQRAVENDLFGYYEDEANEGRRTGAQRDMATELLNVDTDSQTAEDALPSLNDILAASFAHPHEDHFGHVLASHDREHGEDHHFEPVNYRRDIIRTKHATRKNRRKRRDKLHILMRGASSFSISSSRTDRPDNLPVLDETDDVPDIPIPVAEYPGARDEFERESVAIPMVELGGEGAYEQEEEEKISLDTPLSPHIIVKSSSSRNTDV